MSDKPYNEPAFPVVAPSGEPLSGMMLRDYFAARFMDRAQSLAESDSGAWSCEQVASLCYEMADAMLAERVKP